MLPNSYAALGRQLPARRITSALPAGLKPAPTPGLSVERNLQGWIVPQAQVRWLGPGVAWYSPQRVEQIWRQALAGDLGSQWEMFDLMEATWPELSTCLGQLKDEVLFSDPMQFKPFSVKGQDPTPSAEDKCAFVEAAFESMQSDAARDENDLTDTKRDLLDARAKGLSVLEVDWHVTELSGIRPNAILPRCTRWVHPLWYGYPYGPGSGLLQLRAPRSSGPKPPGAAAPFWPGDTSMGYGYNPGTAAWMDFPEHKFIIGLAKNKTGHPLGAAMLHVLGFWWAASNFTAEWFLNFCQVFGQPFRWATYDPSMTPNDQAKLQAMLTTMGASAWGMFPAGTAFELKDVAAKAGDNIQLALMDRADKVARLIILRQTLTADVGDKGGGSKALGQVHERVEGKVVTAVSSWLGKTMAGLARSILILNHGDDSECPLIGPPEEQEDASVLADTLVKVNQAGLEPTDDAIPDLSKRLTFDVQRKAVVTAGMDLGNGGMPTAGSNGDKGEGDKSAKELAAVSAAFAGAAPDGLVPSGRVAAVTTAYRGSMAPFRQIIIESKSRDECLAKLSRAYADWKPERLVAEMEEALQLAAAAGAAAAVKSD